MQPATVVKWHELATEKPDMKLSWLDTAEIVRACKDADKLAIDEGTYPFGSTPDFLEGGVVDR